MVSFAEFCAGIGGFRLGLEALGWHCVYSSEIDEQCEQTYRANYGGGFDGRDVADIKTQNIPQFDLLCAGFPCQPFSIAGKRLGFQDDRGNVLFHLLRIIKDIRPPVVFLENVTNFISHNNGSSFRTLKEELTSFGYEVYCTVLDSAVFGVPQQRKRAYIIAFQLGLSANTFSVTKKRTSPTPFRSFIAHGDYSIPISEKWQEYIDLYIGKKNIDQMSFAIPKTRGALERINPGVDLENCVLQLRSSGIRACSVDAPLPTFAVSHSGGGAMIPVYTGERRHINLIEIKRIMGFPDSFEFPVARTHAIKQLSNAVCPAVITSIGKDIEVYLHIISNTTYRINDDFISQESNLLQLSFELL
jgi:DNA (cytosine-5)-methyltransferase 1